MADLSVGLRLLTGQFDRGLTRATTLIHNFRTAATNAARNVNTFQGNLSRAATGIGGFTGSLTMLASRGNIAMAAIVALGAAGVDSLKRFKEFEQEMANFQGILGVDAESMKFFETEAIRLGATTTQTSSLVADAFTKIAGKLPLLLDCKEGLVQVTEASITLAEAAGITVDEAGTALANAINQMGANAVEATKYINVLAAGSRNGAGDINYLTEAMKKIGSTTHSVGMSFEQTVAAIEMLAKTGVVAGSAGRQLRAVIGKLEKLMDDNLKPSIVGIEVALDNLAKKQLNSAQYFNMFGVENLNAARTLVESRKEYKELTSVITGTNTAIDLAHTRTNTLTGATKRLDSAWEELCLTVTGGDFWLNAIDGAARLIGKLDDIILRFKDIEKYNKKGASEELDENWELIKGRIELMIDNYTHTTNSKTGKNYTRKEATEYVLQNYKELLPEYGLKKIDSDYKVGLDNNINFLFKGLLDGLNKISNTNPIDSINQALNSFDTTTKEGLNNAKNYLEGIKSSYSDDPIALKAIEDLLVTYQSKLESLGKYIPKEGSIDYLEAKKKENRIEYNKTTEANERIILNLEYADLENQIKEIKKDANIEINLSPDAEKNLDNNIENTLKAINDLLTKLRNAGATEESINNVINPLMILLKDSLKLKAQIEQVRRKPTSTNIYKLIQETQAAINDFDMSRPIEEYNKLLIKLAALKGVYEDIQNYLKSFDPEYQKQQKEQAQFNKDRYNKASYSFNVNSADTLIGVGNTLNDLFNKDWSEMNFWEAFTSGADAILDTIDAIHSLTDAWKDFIAIKDLITNGTEIGAIAAEASAVTTAEGEKAGAVIAGQTAQTSAVSTGSAIRTAALKAEMAAGSAAAYAYIPFAGIGLAAALIAKFEAMILAAATIPTFEGGGIIDSPFTSGDRNLVRVNGGEMVLNKGQQYNLFQMLDKGTPLGNTGNVTFKIQGKELVGVLNNYNNKMKRVM